MILKWLTPEGNWRWMDGVTAITHHGLQEPTEAQRLAEIYDGKDAPLAYMHDASAFGTSRIDDRASYVVAKIRGERHHLLLDALEVYILSDEGKTVDKFYR